MKRRPPRSTLDRSSAASDVYKRQLEDLLDRLVGAGSGDRVSVADALGVAGERSFGPLLAIGGLIGATPLPSLIHISAPPGPY